MTWTSAVEFAGNLGDAAGGFSALLLAILAIKAVPSVWQDFQGRLKAQQELAEEQAEDIRLERNRNFYGWMSGSLSVYGVENVTTPGEMERAVRELKAGGPSAYVILRVENSANRADSMRAQVDTEKYQAKAPSKREREILEQAKPAPPRL